MSLIHSKLNIYSLTRNRNVVNISFWISPRAISISPLNVSPQLHS
ncbi:hypothetical protein HMPREF1881_01535 [Streptococcus agalactiae]|nr:hypothetical protein HMPREF1881_01535 [Streptococcus agalactiae]